jgi:hypothetical protein
MSHTSQFDGSHGPEDGEVRRLRVEQPPNIADLPAEIAGYRLSRGHTLDRHPEPGPLDDGGSLRSAAAGPHGTLSTSDL